MKKGNRIKKSVRAPHAPLYVALSVFAVIAVALAVLLAGRSKAFALTIPSGYALDSLEQLTAEGSGITMSGGSYLIGDKKGFITLARVSQGVDLEGKTFLIALRSSETLSVEKDENGAVQLEKSFFGIGSDEHPFRGKIVVESVTDNTSITMDGWKVLFNNLSTRASIISNEGSGEKRQLAANVAGAFSLCDTLTVESDTLDISGFRFANATVETDRPAGLVAAKVVCGKNYTGTGSCGIDLTASMENGGTYGVRSAGTVGGLFGTVESDAALDVTLPNTLTLTATTTGGHAGALVGENNGSLTVSGLANLTATATATAGEPHAAGLVGVNSGKIDFANAITVSSSTATGTTAGGVVGENKSGAELKFSGNVTLMNVTATGNIVGGVIGVSEGSFSAVNCTVESAKLTATGDDPVMGGFAGQLTAMTETNIKNIAVDKVDFFGTGDTAHTVGGYFGLLTANAQVNFTSTAASNFTFDSVKSGDVGGIIGKVAGDSAVTVGGIGVVNTFRNNDFSGTLGGAVGTVERGVYLKTENLSVTNTMGKAAEGMADLVGVAEGGAIVDVSGLTYKNTGKDSVLVSKTGKGSVLRLSGTVEDTSAKPGHIVRTQDNSLLYAEDDAKYISAAPTRNDVGNYGQILRNGNIGKIIHFDETTHAVTLDKLDSASNIQLSNHVDAAKLAITLQTHGVFSGVTGIGEGNYNDLLSASITLTGDIDLTNTGVEQFTCAAESAPFTETINGGGKTLTLAIGETIRKVKINDSTQNVGILMDEVNARAYLGAFSALSGATVNDLTVGGTVTYKDHIGTGGKLRIGGLAGYASNSVSISGCTTHMNIEVNAPQGWVDGTYAYIGGFVGQAESADLTVQNNIIAATIDHKAEYLHSNSNGNSVFLGGAIGMAEAKDGKAIDFTGNTIQAKVNQSVQVNNAHVGGFIADLVCAGYVDVNMTDTKANGASVTSNASSAAGGLIGYNFQKCRLTLGGAWAGTVNAQNSVGGLLYKLDGKLTVNAGFSVNGSTFTSKTGDRGILLGDGTDAFVIIRCNSSGFESVTADGFDLFVGKNITATASNGVAAEGGLVTVETGGDIGKLPDAGNGWYALMNSHTNGNTRYYFNAAGLEGYQKTTEFAAKDLIYWNVYDFVQKALPDYVMAESFPTAVNDIENKSADVDLSGYCFYPTKKEGVTFDFGGHTLTFGVENPPTAAQFYGLQSGVFSDITPVDNGDITANFRNVVLAGTVQPVGNNSGAFVCGKIAGKSDTGGTAIARVAVSDVFLSGLTVAGTANYRPLLIHTIDSYSSCTISDLSQYTKGTYKNAEKSDSYNDGVKAASSLIGHGGVSSNGKLSEYVSVVFKDIVLAGETGDTIFTKATLFDSIACTDNTSSFTYNFNLADDWANKTTHRKAVTYGTELSTNSKQYEYHDQKLFVNPKDYPTAETGANGHFTGGYMPYVRDTDASSAVLRVNWKVVVFDGGWGTYEHPYEISKPEQLTFLSELVGGTVTGFDRGWNILYPKKVNNTPDYTQSEQYTADSSGVLKNGSGAELSVSELLTYLRGAYYKITVATLTAEDGFIGIGNTAYPFHGVIVGAGVGTRTTITMPAKTDVGSEGYGFINTANGCAVYGLNIQYNEVGLSNGSYSEATSRPFNGSAKTGVSHFGGVIAWVIGGDNVVDNVSVSVKTLTAGHKTSVFGGYVGFVTGGGVTVRGLGGGVSKEQTAADSNYYYYNPYVGKMLCGYVLSDGERYNNTGKNYDIPNITKKMAKTQYKNNTFTLADADDVYMLGFAINGGAFKNNENKAKGLAGDDAIAYGKNSTSLSRHGNYSGVGVAAQSEVTLVGGRYEDDSRAEGTSLFSDYFGSGVTNIDQKTNITLNLTGTEYDLSTYPNAFRGFGSPYAGPECYTFGTVQGKTDEQGNPLTTVTMAVDLKQYCVSSYEADSMLNLAFVIENSGNGSKIAYSGVKLSGKISLRVMDAGTGSEIERKINDASKLFCLAGFVGYANNATFSHVAIDGLTVHSPGWAGGLIASAEYGTNIAAVDGFCANALTLEGYQSVGTAFAFLRVGGSGKPILQNIQVEDSVICLKASEILSTINQNYNASAGGLIGYTDKNSMRILNSAVSGTRVIAACKTISGESNGHAGGFVGYSTTALTLENCTLNSSEVLACSDFLNSGKYPTDHTEINAAFSNVETGKAVAYALSNSTVNSAAGSGGFVGYTTAGCSIAGGRVLSDTAATVILGYGNAGGFVGAGNGAQSYTDLTAQTDGNPIYIIGKSRAAGVTAYGSNAVTATNITVQGTEAAPVYILADGTSAPAAGLFAEINSSTDTLNGENAELSGCIIAGAGAAGAVVKYNGHAVLSNLKIFGNFIQGGSNSAAGVLGTAAISRNTTLDGLYLGGNVIRKGGAVSNAGLIAGTLNGGNAVFTGYDLLLKGNDAGYGKAKSAKDILSAASRTELHDPATDTDQVGLVAYENLGTVNILAISAEEADYPRIVKESSEPLKPVLVFAGYGAPTVFENAYVTNANKDYTPKRALADCGITPAGLESLLNGDPMTKQDTEFTADFLNGKTDKLWDNAQLHLESTGMEALSDIVKGVGNNADLPVLHITGKTDETMAAYLNLITNGGYGCLDSSAFTVTASSDRYTLNDGKLTLAEEGDGSIGYENGKFVAGKYDNLESEENKSLSILTVTFADKATGTHAYTLHAVIYYPQVLEYTSAITALEGEVYRLSSLEKANNAIDIMDGSKFTLYIEYAYNDVAGKIEDYNLDEKYVKSHDINDKDKDGKQFPAGTKLVLIDLNSTTAAGFKGYYYTVPSDTATIDLSSFCRGEKLEIPFEAIHLQQVVENGIGNRITDGENGKYSHVERYLMVVIPSGTDTAGRQYNLVAKVGDNTRNITVIGNDKTIRSGNISLWKLSQAELSFSDTSQQFSNTSDQVLQSKLSVTQQFEGAYLNAMSGRALYGTHVLKITQGNDKTGVTLPAGTVITLTRTLPDGSSERLISTRLTQPGSSVRYPVGNVLEGLSGSNTAYSDAITVSLDFSGASPLEFNRCFNEESSYYLSDSFYLSGDTEHYAGGTETTCATAAFNAKKASPIKLALVPKDRKSLAINFGNLAETTDSGVIDFDLATDFSAVEAEGVEVESVEVKFSVQKKMLADGEYVYRTLNDGDTAVVASLTGTEGGTNVTDYAAKLPIQAGCKTADTFRLTVDMDAVRNAIPKDNEKAQNYDVFTNYRLVADVTIRGNDLSKEDRVTYTASSYFTFLLCNIYGDVY